MMIDSRSIAPGHKRATPHPIGSAWPLDGLAMSASALCLLHCLALPVAIAFLPMLAAVTAGGAWFHIGMLAITIPLSGGTLVVGWRRHGAIVPVAIGAPGLGLLVAGLGFEGQAVGTMLTVAGGVLLALAHLRNRRASAMARLATR